MSPHARTAPRPVKMQHMRRPDVSRGPRVKRVVHVHRVIGIAQSGAPLHPQLASTSRRTETCMVVPPEQKGGGVLGRVLVLLRHVQPRCPCLCFMVALASCMPPGGSVTGTWRWVPPGHGAQPAPAVRNNGDILPRRPGGVERVDFRCGLPANYPHPATGSCTANYDRSHPGVRPARAYGHRPLEVPRRLRDNT